jgi:membrane-bound lytic murein transglycosylase D
MRFIFSALLVLMLAACASGGPSASNSANNPAPADPQAAADQLRKTSAAQETIDVDNGSVSSLTSQDADLWGRIRRGFQMPDLQSDLVDMNVQWYAERPDYVARMTERSQKYLYHIVEELEARHMPTELALLPFIESAYNPQALSVAKAAGMWQFVPDTGRTYNLKQNMWQDERRDVLASTSAALDYLSRLHDMFGDWYLALAAYNWGEGNVQRAIARNQAAGLPTDYQSLRLPNETRNYVPKLQAVKNIVMNPQQYGLTLPSIPNHPYFVTVTTSHDIDVDVAAKLANMTPDEFRSLNPSFKKPVILGATQPQILLPFDNASAFEHNLKDYTGQLSSWTVYTTDARTTPAALAEKIGVDADTLMSVNKIPAGMRLKAGSTLVVPRTDGDDDEDISADVAESAVLAMEPDVPDTRKMLIRVRRKQAMDAVASRYGVSVGQLKGWNKTHRDYVMPGQVLVLHVPVGKAMPSEPGPERIATNVSGGGVQRIGTKVADTSSKSRYDKKHGRERAEVVKVSDPVKAKSPVAAPSKASKGTASRQKAGTHTQKQTSK